MVGQQSTEHRTKNQKRAGASGLRENSDVPEKRHYAEYLMCNMQEQSCNMQERRCNMREKAGATRVKQAQFEPKKARMTTTRLQHISSAVEPSLLKGARGSCHLQKRKKRGLSNITEAQIVAHVKASIWKRTSSTSSKEQAKD